MDFEVVYAKIIDAEDFFDAIEKSQKDGVEILTVSKVPSEIDDVYNE